MMVEWRQRAAGTVAGAGTGSELTSQLQDERGLEMAESLNS